MGGPPSLTRADLPHLIKTDPDSRVRNRTHLLDILATSPSQRVAAQRATTLRQNFCQSA